MAKSITKFKYLKPNSEMSVGGYAKYIATREGVEKIDYENSAALATEKQKRFIKKLLVSFPDTAEMLEYEDYLSQGTVASASELITQAVENNAHDMIEQQNLRRLYCHSSPCKALRITWTVHR